MHLLRRALNLRLAGQAITIKVSANLVVQILATWGSATGRPFDWQQVAEFALYGLVGSQVGNVVQFLLEDWFPTRTTAEPAAPVELESVGHGDEKVRLDHAPRNKPRSNTTTAAEAAVAGVATEQKRAFLGMGPDINWANVLVKLLLDQTIGLLISGTIFLVCTNIARAPHPSVVLQVLRDRLWPLIKAGWHLWPLVAMINFLWVPVRQRVLVAVCVGFGWSIFLSIFAMRS